MARKQRIVIVGVGPRGLSALERIVARAAAHPELAAEVHLVDPFPPGAGHVWRTDQSRLYLMNTPAFFPTVVPSDRTLATAEGPTPPAPVPAVAGLTFARWRQLLAEDPSRAVVGLSEEDVVELRAMGPSGFPSRKIYGTYLSDVHARLMGALPAGIGVSHHAQEAVRVAAAGPRADRPYRVELGDGVVLSADAVILALGHTDATLRDDQQDLMEFAAQHGARYQPPAVPADVRWGALPAGRNVLVRGMGLNFHDVLTRVTEGRGGVFEEDPADSQRLIYRPSGREPKIWVASRRGTPYRAKAVLDSYYPPSVDNRFFTREVVDRTRAAAAEQGREVDFEAEYWPLIRRDAQWNYYRTLVRTDPDAVQGDPQEFLREVERILTDPDQGSWWARMDRFAAQRVQERLILRPERLMRPFAGVSFDSHEEYAAALVHFLDRDVAASFAAQDSPLKMAIGSLNLARALAKHAVRDRGISGESWLRGLERSFGALTDGLASGPPVLRIQQTAALARAGILRFLGPDPVFSTDPETGCFAASSPWVRDEPVEATWMVEALAPANDVRASTSPLIGGLFEDGLARPYPLRLGDGAAPTTGRGFDVTASPYRLIRADGAPEPGVYVLGLQLSSAQWGTAIAAQTDAELAFSASTLADAEAAVAAILGPVGA
ncbi:FAD/NAD(P)-binding protein [Rothia kristinae]|uniref:FAD/NAD(P)-binding protein n=1 Tax=Rothia kristinae TaxID=37923 RepID=A0A7T3CIN8_9MICC|nr:FAD/NAD(P)-binding protein [Rothia kristinae]QPT54114.1 FAD/NAD(P)-binding protein [Rothia kristinae]